MELIATDNQCGTCNVCCSLCEVKELNKESGTLCSHWDNGCTIYSSRPTECSSYSCLWLLQKQLGNPLPEKYRPDNLGVLFEKPYPAKFWVGVEIKKDAMNSKEGVTLILGLTKDNSPVLLKRGLKREYALPEGMSFSEFEKLQEEYFRS